MIADFKKKFEGLNTENINDVDTGFSALFAEQNLNQEKTTPEITFEKLIPFPVELLPERIQPFHPATGTRLEELTQSIQKHGIADPIIIRESKKKIGFYEIIAGHNRVNIAKLLGMTSVPYHLKNVSDVEAVDLFLDTNLTHRDLSIKEKALAYKAKLINSNCKGKRTDLLKSEKYDAARDISKSKDESKSKIIRMARLTYLIPELLDAVDQKQLPIMAGYNLSFLAAQDQETVYECWQVDHPKISVPMSEKISELSKKNNITEIEIDKILNSKAHTKKEKEEKSVTLRFPASSYAKYFPGMKPKQAQEKLIEILDQYLEYQNK